MYKKSLAYPHLVWMTLFVVVPIILVLIYSFTVTPIDGEAYFSFDNYKNFFDITYMRIFIKSLWIALISSIYCIILGYPAAMILANRDREKLKMGKKAGGMLMLFVMPMWMNMMLRTYSWLTILEKNGLLNQLMRFLHLPDINLLYTENAVILGMIYDFLPFMIMPIYSVLMKIDDSVLEAARDLGANSVKSFTKVTLPLSIPGIISGFTMVFLPAITTFYIPNIFGGGKVYLIGNVIQERFLVADDWNFGSAMSIVMMILVFISMKVMNIFDKEKKSH